MGKASRRKKERQRQGGVGVLEDFPGAFGKKVAWVERPEGFPKLSEALVELIEPFLTGDEDLVTVRKLIQIGVIAWNVSLDEETNPEEILEDVGIDKVEGAEFLRAFLLDLVDRKRFLFPYDGRDIVAWDVNPQPEGGFYIRAATLTVGE